MVDLQSEGFDVATRNEVQRLIDDSVSSSVRASDAVKVPNGILVWTGSGWTANNATPMGVNAIRIRRTVDYGIPNITDTQVFMDTIVYQQGNIALGGAGPNYIQIQETGYYLCQGQASWIANAAGYRQARLSTLTTELARTNTPSIGGVDKTVNNVSGVYLLQSGDQLSMYLYQTSGGALNADNVFSWLEAIHLSRVG